MSREDLLELAKDTPALGATGWYFLGLPADRWALIFALVLGAARAASALWDLWERFKTWKAKRNGSNQ